MLQVKTRFAQTAFVNENAPFVCVLLKVPKSAVIEAVGTFAGEQPVAAGSPPASNRPNSQLAFIPLILCNNVVLNVVFKRIQ